MLTGTTGQAIGGYVVSATTGGSDRIALGGARMVAIRAGSEAVCVKFGGSTVSADSSTTDGTGYDSKIYTEDGWLGFAVPPRATHVAIQGVGGTVATDVTLIA